MSSLDKSEIIWKPKSIESSQMYKFMQKVNLDFNLELKNYDELHAWSISHREIFWRTLLDGSGIVYEGSSRVALENDSFIDYPWFPDVRLNFAENLLQAEDENIALVGLHESWPKKTLSYKELRSKVSSLQQYLENINFQKGDVLACYMPNTVETVIAMLACTSLGGVFTSTSPDFGLDGVLSRFGQSKPKVLMMALGYEYNEKKFDLSERLFEIKKQINSLEKILYVNYLSTSFSTNEKDVVNLEEAYQFSEQELKFLKVEFSHPLYIMYSSGTTGKPKCIVHSTGGTLLQHYKELALHTDLKKDERILYFTTCGWMMWNWLVSSLMIGAQTYLYEGSPAYPSLKSFTDLLIKEEINVFGTSPKYLKALETYNWKKTQDFSSLRLLMSTGAPLVEEQFDFIHRSMKEDVQIASICGGTDIISCFMLGNPMKELRRGELQCLGLGMDVSSFNSEGEEVINAEGELVCKQSFVSQPLYFLNDHLNERRKKAYFQKFSDTWHHGDFIYLTDRKTIKVMGRSDATLNPGGVRIGTAEIYQQTEKIEDIQDCVCVGKNSDGEVDVALFVKMKRGVELCESKIKEIKSLIRKGTTPRHVPKFIYPVSDIPYTRSGKKMEILVSRLINGREPDNLEAVSNVESLDDFRQYI